jgi:CheY-like chemotaxis protein
LLIEDNEMNRDMLSRRLERKGVEVGFACDGPTGIAAAAAEIPDLILIDVGLGLGKMDGWEVTRKIKAEPATAGIPVIALTAHAMATDRLKECRGRLRRFRYQARRLQSAAHQDRHAAAGRRTCRAI